MTKQQRYEEFEKLKIQGIKRLEIIKKLGISESTYDNYNNEYKKGRSRNKDKVPFDILNYFGLCMSGVKYENMYGIIYPVAPYPDCLPDEFLTKSQIAKCLGITEKTLISYEKKYLLKNFYKMASYQQVPLP